MTVHIGPVIPALRRLKSFDQELETNLGYKLSLVMAWATYNLVLK